MVVILLSRSEEKNSMGLLDDEEKYVPPYRPPERGQGRRYEKQTILSQEDRDRELNNINEEDES